MIFCLLIKIYETKCYFNNYWVGMLRNGQNFLDHGTLKSCYLTKDLMNWAY